MYMVNLINMGYSKGSFKNLAEAIAAAKETGFECSIVENGLVCCVVSPIGGVRYFN